MARTSTPHGRKRAPRDRDEHGFVLVWMGLVLVLMISMGALAVDLVHAYAEAQHLQNAVDAAALGGAVEIPADLNGATARGRVQSLLNDNGYPTNPDTTVMKNDKDTNLGGNVANQMDVEVKHKFKTLFAGIIGIGDITVRKHANAQYDPPTAMGSPANNLGDVPSCPPGSALLPSCVSVPTNTNQHLWINAQGTGGFKHQGNALMTARCSLNQPTDPIADGCTGATNDEYVAGGGTENLLVQDDQPGPLNLWIYDPGFVHTGPTCNGIASTPPVSPGDASLWNDGVPADVDVYNHYGDPNFCTSDFFTSGGPSAVSGPGGNLGTTYTVYDTDGTTVLCTQTFPGYQSAGALSGPNNLWTTGHATNTFRGFHQWVELCPGGIAGQPTSPGHEYRVQVSTGGGAFNNQFSIVALHGTNAPGPTSQLTVFTRQHLPLFAIDPTSSPHPRFYLSRILPSSRDRVLEIDFFDLGDSSFGSTTGGLSFSWIAKPGFSGFSNCSWVPVPTSATASQLPPPFPSASFTSHGCTWSYTSATSAANTWNGRWVALRIVIPSSTAAGGWDCDPSNFQSCWLQLNITPSGPFSDATTWDAQIVGSPVRLVG